MMVNFVFCFVFTYFIFFYTDLACLCPDNRLTADADADKAIVLYKVLVMRQFLMVGKMVIFMLI